MQTDDNIAAYYKERKILFPILRCADKKPYNDKYWNQRKKVIKSQFPQENWHLNTQDITPETLDTNIFANLKDVAYAENHPSIQVLENQCKHLKSLYNEISCIETYEGLIALIDLQDKKNFEESEARYIPLAAKLNYYQNSTNEYTNRAKPLSLNEKISLNFYLNTMNKIRNLLEKETNNFFDARKALIAQKKDYQMEIDELKSALKNLTAEEKQQKILQAAWVRYQDYLSNAQYYETDQKTFASSQPTAFNPNLKYDEKVFTRFIAEEAARHNNWLNLGYTSGKEYYNQSYLETPTPIINTPKPCPGQGPTAPN